LKFKGWKRAKACQLLMKRRETVLVKKRVRDEAHGDKRIKEREKSRKWGK
jgi:hypothetical protein